MSDPIKYEPLVDDPEGMKYILLRNYVYTSKRYGKTISLKEGMKSDGATGFIDVGADNLAAKVYNLIRFKVHGAFKIVKSAWFFVHDRVCNTGLWDDGTGITNWQASTVALDILIADGWVITSVFVWLATFFLGGGEAKKNGMFRLT